MVQRGIAEEGQARVKDAEATHHGQHSRLLGIGWSTGDGGALLGDGTGGGMGRGSQALLEIDHQALQQFSPHQGQADPDVPFSPWSRSGHAHTPIFIGQTVEEGGTRRGGRGSLSLPVHQGSVLCDPYCIPERINVRRIVRRGAQGSDLEEGGDGRGLGVGVPRACPLVQDKGRTIQWCQSEIVLFQRLALALRTSQRPRYQVGRVIVLGQ
mmetsp:Transcript_33559/g.100025  ORF Transcript_33559/g.100025 Transcript_33559/m.100025 type:complete len:211 (-) Transcript_33559:869-1501(-)